MSNHYTPPLDISELGFSHVAILDSAFKGLTVTGYVKVVNNKDFFFLYHYTDENYFMLVHNHLLIHKGKIESVDDLIGYMAMGLQRPIYAYVLAESLEVGTYCRN